MSTELRTVRINASIDGQYFAVQSATLYLGVNDIPTIELVCAPDEATGAQSLIPNVKKAKLAVLAKTYQNLASKAEAFSTEGNIVLELLGIGETQQISLKGWILTGVGMSSACPSSVPSLSVIFQHPICNLMKSGSIYETAKTSVNDKLNEATQNAKTFLQVVDAVYDCVNDKIKYWPIDDGNGIASQFRQMLKTEKPSKYLAESDAGLFLSCGNTNGIRKRVAQAIGRMILPRDGGSSTWDMLMNATGDLLLSVVQDQKYNFTTSKLLLEPTQPWKEYDWWISDEACTRIDLAGMNPYKISGVMSEKRGPYNDLVSSGLIGNGNLGVKAPNSSILYSPIKNPDVADGRIMKIPAPGILEAAFRRDAQYGEDISSGLSDMMQESLNGYNRVIKKYAQAVYEISVGSMVRANVEATLFFNDSDGNMILPGQTCMIMSDGAPLYYGYIQRVVHHMSVEGGCSTNLSMSHVRPTPGLESNGTTLVEAGAPNAAYT